MRRTTAAVEVRAETPTALIDRLSAEYDGPGHDDGLSEAYGDTVLQYAIDGVGGGDGDGDNPAADPVAESDGISPNGPISPADRSADGVDRSADGIGGTVPDDDPAAVTGPIPAVAAASDPFATAFVGPVDADPDPQRAALDGPTGRHRRPGSALVSHDTAPTGGRSTVRRLVPLGAGAVVALVAATVLTLVPQPPKPAPAPELQSQLAPAPDPAAPTAGGTMTSSAAPPPPPSAAPKPAAPRRAAPRVVSGVSDGTTAASRFGWRLSAGDEFGGSGLSGNWGAYDGPGHGGQGRRTPDAISVSGGILRMRGDSDGNTGGMAWNGNQTYGKWEVRARMPRGDDQYHPVLLLWPESGWPPEVDFSETSSASHGTKFFLHFGSSNDQVSGSSDVDITQWHNYAVDWEPGSVTGYIDGVKWFQSTDGGTVPDQPMHLAIQLDYFPDGGSPQPSELDVAYVRIYR
jgi:Glycosyl hydrolases family 16